MPTGTVTRFSLVIYSDTLDEVSLTKRKSLLVKIPHNLPFFTTGIPEILYFVISSQASPIVWSGSIVIGSTIIPLSERFTLSTSSACFSIDIFLWIKPRPPT